MNKRGQNLILALMAAAMIFVSGMLFLNHIKDDVSLTRSINLDCSNPNNSDGTKLTCLGVDLVVPIVFLLIISLAGGIIFDRFMMS